MLENPEHNIHSWNPRLGETVVADPFGTGVFLKYVLTDIGRRHFDLECLATGDGDRVSLHVKMRKQDTPRMKFWRVGAHGLLYFQSKKNDE